jgi:hypothetical protein
MHSETQANRLAELMQKKRHLPSYELALPLVTVRSSDLEKLAIDDVLLLGLNCFECILLDNGTICANVILIKQNNRHMMKIIKIDKVAVKTNDSKKYETIKLSLGMVQCRTLTLEHTIDIAQINLEHIALMHRDKKIATASLINTDGELAVKIDKVNKDGYKSNEQTRDT